MKKVYAIPILFKIDADMLARLDGATDELGQTRSLFIRDAIARRICDYERRERPVLAQLKPEGFDADGARRTGIGAGGSTR